jgi:digeranylgeranylglycerophospholipid reductase
MDVLKRFRQARRTEEIVSPGGFANRLIATSLSRDWMELEYDVLVIGAGPAGSCAARYAAEAGCDTLLIEKRPEIGTPVRCGEGIAKRWLDEIQLEPSNRWVANEIDGARIISPDGSTLFVDESLAGNECGFVIERDLFDRALARRAAKAGADIMVKTSARGLIREDGRVVGARCERMGKRIDVRASIVIGADGFESQVGRWAGIDTWLRPRDMDACLQYTLMGIEGDPRFNEFHLGSMAPGGYLWIFWKGDELANVGVGVNLAKCRRRAAAKHYLDRFIEARPELSKGKVIEEMAGGVSVSRPVDRSVVDGLMLVGDAARLIDPVTGGGILNGCISGMMAGETAGEALEAEDCSEHFLMRYEKRWRDRMENTLYRNWMIKEKMLEMSDDTINKIVSAIAEVPMDQLTMMNILEAVRQKCPELVREYEGLM